MNANMLWRNAEPTGLLLRESRRGHPILQLWLGHKSIQHTVKYAELSAERFKDW